MGSDADSFRGRVEELISEYREALLGSLDDLSDDEARARLVPSKTTLLGLVKRSRRQPRRHADMLREQILASRTR